MPTTNAPTIRAVADCSSAEVASALNTCFERYFVQMDFSPERYERRFRSEHLDPYASRLWFDGQRPMGIVLVARRGWTSRIAAMAVAVDWRGKGIGRRMLEAAIAEARARGDRAMLLEVIEQNAPARSLYESLGFVNVRRLVGYRRAEGLSGVPEPLTVCDPTEVARVVAREASAELPWGLAPETLSGAALPAQAWSLGGNAWAIVSDPSAATLGLAALIVPREVRRQRWGTRLLQAVAAEFPGKGWTVPGIVPDSLAPGFFGALGFEQQPITQLELRLDLTPR